MSLHPLISTRALLSCWCVIIAVCIPTASAGDAFDQPEKDTEAIFGSDNCEPRGTLFRWSYGSGSGGGPNLDEPIVTDRPDFTEASSTVGCGVFQIESGYTFAFDRDGPAKTQSHSFPEALLRYGIVDDWLEMRLATNFAGETFNTSSETGMEDLYVGMKLA